MKDRVKRAAGAFLVGAILGAFALYFTLNIPGL